jgi:hypothetical protein
MADKRLFDTNVSEEEYDSLQDKYVTIPPGVTGIAQEGDTIYENVEAGVADWKQPGKSLTIPLTVVSEGMNKGKTVEWYAGVAASAMGITKTGLKAFGIEDKVLVRSGGKIKIDPMGFAGARARAMFRREMSQNHNLRSVLDSTAFLPIGAKSETKDIGF